MSADNALERACVFAVDRGVCIYPPGAIHAEWSIWAGASELARGPTFEAALVALAKTYEAPTSEQER